jgi:hypothetical protein
MAGKWSEVTLKFATSKPVSANAIVFILPDKTELHIDDVLL